MEQRAAAILEKYSPQLIVPRDLTAGGRAATLLFNPDITDGVTLRMTVHALTKYEGKLTSAEQAAKEVLTAAEVKIADTPEEAAATITDGDAALFIEGFRPIVVNARKYDKRAVAEPPSETVTRGPREGFIEELKTNLSLIARRLRTEKLTVERLKTGRYSGTNVAVVYLDGVADPKIVQKITERIRALDTDGVEDSFYIQSVLEEHPYSIFSQIGMTEKPDIAVAKLLEGRVAVVVDGSPTVLTVPYILPEDFQASEDYYERHTLASFLRILRYTAVVLAILLPGFYVAVQVYHYDMIPLKFLVTLMNAVAGLPLTPLSETLFVIMLFEIIREAGVRMPRAVGMALSIVGALVLGDTAVKAGLISSPSVMVVALSSIALYTVPKLVGTTSILRLLMTLAGGLGGMYGLVVSTVFLLMYLAGLDSYGAPYLAPFAPLVRSDLKDALIRKPLGVLDTRPQSYPNVNRIRRKPWKKP